MSEADLFSGHSGFNARYSACERNPSSAIFSLPRRKPGPTAPLHQPVQTGKALRLLDAQGRVERAQQTAREQEISATESRAEWDFEAWGRP